MVRQGTSGMVHSLFPSAFLQLATTDFSGSDDVMLICFIVMLAHIISSQLKVIASKPTQVPSIPIYVTLLTCTDDVYLIIAK